jgi:hypothetical protein
MAKRRRARGTGSVIAVRQLNGLGKVSRPGTLLGSLVPPVVGGGLVGGVMLALEHMGKPSADGNQPSPTMVTMAENSELIGAGAGLIGAAAMYPLLGAPAAASAAAGAVVVGLAIFALKSLQKSEITASTVPATAVPGAQNPSTKGLGSMYQTRSMGAIVPQLMPRGMNGTGAIVMEQQAMRGLGDPRGETVSLGNVNPGAFGTPGFQI